MTALTKIMLLVWPLFLVGGSYWLAVHPNTPQEAEVPAWKAVRPLAKNHQLTEQDLDGPKERSIQAKMLNKNVLVGKHLTRGVQKAEAIVKEDVSDAPSFEGGESGSGIWFYTLKEGAPPVEAMRPGAWVVICSVLTANAKAETRCSNGALAVEAMHKARAEGDSSWVALRVPKCRYQEVGEFIAQDKGFLLVAVNSPLIQERACVEKPKRRGNGCSVHEKG